MNPHYEQIVVGSSLRALLFAGLYELPVFFTKPDKPKPFELFPPLVDLSSFGLENTLRIWQTPEGEYQTGDYKIYLWEHLLFVLGLKGLAPFSDMCFSLRLDEDCLTGYSEYAKLRSVDFDICHYFDDRGRYNLLPSKNVKPEYEVYDRIAFMRGGKHKYDLIRTTDNFCDSIWFYPTPRVDGTTSIKDACVVSILSEEQVDNFDFSETMARLTTLETMKDLGLRGPKNGYQEDGRPRYRSFKTETINRKKFLSSPPIWIETDTIKAPKISEERLLAQLPEIAKTNKRIIEPLWQNT
mgnify:CR=1 FL=1